VSRSRAMTSSGATMYPSHTSATTRGGRTGSGPGRDELIRALTELNGNVPALRSGSVLGVAKVERGDHYDPFTYGVLGRVDRREELRRRFRSLDARSRAVLFLWFVLDWPVDKIAAQVGVSRSHCYRLREGALRRLEESAA
jgi:DNA-directed RNA polymerase specialized sigma subunit